MYRMSGKNHPVDWIGLTEKEQKGVPIAFTFSNVAFHLKFLNFSPIKMI